MKRMGRRNRPFFRVIVIDSRRQRDGAAIEEVGWYDPIKTEDNFSLKDDRLIHWLQQGAQPSDTVKNLMKKSGLSYRWHLMKQGLDEKAIDHEIQKWSLDRDERLKKKAEERAKAKAEAKEKAEAEAKVKAEAKAESEAKEEPKEEVEAVTEPEEEVKAESEAKENRKRKLRLRLRRR